MKNQWYNYNPKKDEKQNIILFIKETIKHFDDFFNEKTSNLKDIISVYNSNNIGKLNYYDLKESYEKSKDIILRELLDISGTPTSKDSLLYKQLEFSGLTAESLKLKIGLLNFEWGKWLTENKKKLTLDFFDKYKWKKIFKILKVIYGSLRSKFFFLEALHEIIEILDILTENNLEEYPKFNH